MIAPLVIAFATCCAILIFVGLLGRDRIYQYPFLAGAVFTGFILPQVLGLSNDRFLPPGAIESTLILASLSAMMCWLGGAVVERPMQFLNCSYDDRRLLIASAALSAIGGYFYYAISRLPIEMLSNTQWTGLPVAYFFFARVLTYGLAVAVLLYAKNRSLLALLIIGYCTVFYLDRILIGGRRQELVEFVVIFLLAFAFRRDWFLPRSVMMAGVVMGALLINSIGEYRSATMDPDGPRWDAIADINFVGNLGNISEQGGEEVRNAIYNVGAVSRTMDFDLGLYHWNALVFAYVPAQLVGADLKQSFYISLPQPAFEEFFYTAAKGTTFTGLSDAFQSFWYFGCLKFFLIAYVMQKLWLAARCGGMTAQLLYMLLVVHAMEAITHTTQNFVNPWVHITLFLMPALLLARRSIKSQRTGGLPQPPTLISVQEARNAS
jgi:hypothetical protein